MRKLVAWIDSRTGVLDLMRALLYEHIPGGSRWRYVWGSTLVFAFSVQLITGFFLWLYYSPSAQTAWESVYYIQHEVAGGWLLRGIHHYTAQLMIVLLALHMMQVVIDGAYRAPREFNFWIGLVLMVIVLGLGLTGYLLPWDQKSYWATKVATNIVGLTPAIGDDLRRLLVGGPEYGHHTLTRFFALHAGLLPAALIGFLALHVYLFRRHGIHPKDSLRPDASFWPDQVLKDGVACLGVLAAVLLLVFQHRVLGGADAHLGASLMAPAEPSERYGAARPDWYFLSFYQLLKFECFSGEAEVWGAIYLPGIVLAVVVLMPFIGHWRLGHRLNVVLVSAVILSAGVLTGMALVEDARKEDYRHALAQAEEDARRILVLARRPEGIPAAGAAALLRADPKTQGPRLFARHCAGCHRYGGHDGTGRTPAEAPRAADLEGFASREWLTGFFDPARIGTAHYLGATAFAEDGKMIDFVKETVAEYDEEEKAVLGKLIIALSAEAALRSQSEVDRSDAAVIAEGRRFFGRKSDEAPGLNCIRCHTFHGEGKSEAPDLTGYGSRDWLLGMVSDPAHERFYGERNDQMPRFGAELDPATIGLIVDWLRGEWYEE
jgi:ubiquinol-cytochrome c reductase cytochrome b subunit